MTPNFTIQSTTGAARTGALTTSHGTIQTPNFMPVATRGVFHGMEIHDAADLGVEVIMCNTFHLSREVGAEKIAAAGGMAKHMSWSGATATDSGGFQVFSYGWSRRHGVMKMPGGINTPTAMATERGEGLVTIDDDGVTFTENGRVLRLTPAESIRLQELIGADICFAFDEPTSPFHDHAYNQESLGRTHRWAAQCLDAKTRDDQMLLGVVQGGPFRDLREQSATAIAAMPFGGFAIGGSYDAGGAATALGWARPFLGEERPRHMLGIGWVKDIIMAVDAGADLFDCVEPIRRARHMNVLTNGVYRDIVPVARKQGEGPLVNGCDCSTCRTMSATQVKTLVKAGDFAGPPATSQPSEARRAGSRALAIHNVRTMVKLMSDIRRVIDRGDWSEWRDEQLRRIMEQTPRP